jgi:hypothetical protein
MVVTCEGNGGFLTCLDDLLKRGGVGLRGLAPHRIWTEPFNVILCG